MGEAAVHVQHRSCSCDFMWHRSKDLSKEVLAHVFGEIDFFQVKTEDELFGKRIDSLLPLQ